MPQEGRSFQGVLTHTCLDCLITQNVACLLPQVMGLSWLLLKTPPTMLSKAQSPLRFSFMLCLHPFATCPYSRRSCAQIIRVGTVGTVLFSPCSCSCSAVGTQSICSVSRLSLTTRRAADLMPALRSTKGCSGSHEELMPKSLLLNFSWFPRR